MNEHDKNEGQTPPEESAPIESLPMAIDHAPASSQVLIKAYEQTGTVPVTPEQAAILLAPIDPENDVDIHPLSGVLYVTWIRYVRRLNAAFGPMGWSSVRVGQAEIEEGTDKSGKPFVDVSLRVALVVNGRLVRDAVGECRQHEGGRMSVASCMEGAVSNGIKRCCKSLGMFDELLDKRWAEQWTATYAEYAERERKWQRRKTTTPRQNMSTPQSPAPPPPAKKAASSMKNVTEGFVRKAEKTTESGTYLLTIETEEGEVQLKGNSSLAKYPDKSQLVDLLVEFTTKEVPQRGGGIITVLDTLEIKGEPA